MRVTVSPSVIVKVSVEIVWVATGFSFPCATTMVHPDAARHKRPSRVSPRRRVASCRSTRMNDKTFVIVGASLAGAKAAAELRERGFDGRVVLVGTEQELPYERPPLSKDYLRGESERDGMQVHDQAFYKDQEIELRLGTTATAIDRPPEASNSAAGTGSGSTRCCSRPARARVDCSCPARSSTASTTCARSPTATRSAHGFDARRPPGGHRQRLDRLRGRRERPPARRGGDHGRRRRRSRMRGSSARAVGQFYRDLHAGQGVELVLERRRRRVRGRRVGQRRAHRFGSRGRVRLRRGRRRGHAQRRARPAGRARHRQRDPGRPAAAELSAERVRGRRHRQSLAPVLRAARARRALGQRAQPGAGGGAIDAW